MSVEKRVRAYLELAGKDVDAAELLLAGGNRYSAYHVQQAVEKITKALLLAQGIEAGIEHRLEELFKRFAADSAWPAQLLPFVGYSAYATAFRYPTPWRSHSGRSASRRATSRHILASRSRHSSARSPFSAQQRIAEVDFRNCPVSGHIGCNPDRYPTH